MPKKRAFNFKPLQGSSTSSGKHNGVGDGVDKPAASVNERLSELRKIEGRDAAQKKRELVEAISSNQRSVPPSLRGVLGISESAPPKPKRGLRTRIPNRTPGPAPPQSWLKRAAWTPALTFRGGRNLRISGAADKDRNRPKQLLGFDRLTGLEAGSVDERPSSLLHIALKTAAEHWHMFDDDDLPVLGELPLRLRLRLLSYLGFYGPSIDVGVLDALTQGSEPVTHIDLAGIVGTRALPLHRVAKLANPRTASATHSLTFNSVLDSWDEDDGPALTPSLSVCRFSHLTHLSLSHPSPGASWRDLLSLSKHTPSVTHLSLAYWPRPTLTPNLATATISSQHSPDVSAGGSHYYSGLDNDHSEPASLLRQLSGNLLRLQWLDLEGCVEWIPALSFLGGEVTVDEPHHTQNDAWSRTSAVASIFVHNWKNLQYLNFSQGWLPTLGGLRALPKQTIAASRKRIIDDFVQSMDALEGWKAQLDDVYEVDKRKAEMWLRLEEEAIATHHRIHGIRKANNCRAIAIDHGWERKTF